LGAGLRNYLESSKAQRGPKPTYFCGYSSTRKQNKQTKNLLRLGRLGQFCSFGFLSNSKQTKVRKKFPCSLRRRERLERPQTGAPRHQFATYRTRPTPGRAGLTLEKQANSTTQFLLESHNLEEKKPKPGNEKKDKENRQNTRNAQNLPDPGPAQKIKNFSFFLRSTKKNFRQLSHDHYSKSESSIS